MGKKTKTPTPSTKGSPPENSPSAASSPDRDYEDILDSVDKKLSSFDTRIALVEVLHREFQPLHESLEFSQQQVASLVAENENLRDSAKSLTKGMTKLSEENKQLKESILNIETRNMRDNRVFSGIPEWAEEDPKAYIK